MKPGVRAGEAGAKIVVRTGEALRVGDLAGERDGRKMWAFGTAA